MAVVLPEVSALERFLAALAQVERAEGVPGVRAIHEYPPENLAALPAVINAASGGSWEEAGFDALPAQTQDEIDVFEIYVYSDQTDAHRARHGLLPVLDELRRIIGRHKALAGAFNVRPTSWRMGVLEFAEQQYHGLQVSGEVRFRRCGEFAA